MTARNYLQYNINPARGVSRSMWLQTRPLRRLTYSQRVGSPPLPAAWVAEYVRLASGYPSADQSLWLAAFYVVVCVWYGSLREITARRISATRRHPTTFNWWRDGLLRFVNHVSDAAAAACFLYFLVFDEPSYFPLVFFVSVSTHCFVEMEIAHRLKLIHSDHAYLGGRRPTVQELAALEQLDDLVDEEVSVQKSVDNTL